MNKKRERAYQIIILIMFIIGMSFIFFSSRFENDKQDILDKITTIESSQKQLIMQNTELQNKVALVSQIASTPAYVPKDGKDGVTEIIHHKEITHVFEPAPPAINGKDGADAPRARFGQYPTGEFAYLYPGETIWTMFEKIDIDTEHKP
jgi:hypothetical protein